MSQNAYTVGLKVKNPKIQGTKPQKSSTITFILKTVLLGAIAITVAGLASLSLPLIFLAVALYIAYGAGKNFRNKNFRKDKQHYKQQISDNWITTNSFIKMRDFLMLMGFNPETAYEIADELGTEIIYNKSFAQTQGYYPLATVEGNKAFAAVQVQTLLSKKGNIKLTAKVLQEV